MQYVGILRSVGENWGVLVILGMHLCNLLPWMIGGLEHRLVFIDGLSWRIPKGKFKVICLYVPIS